MSYVGLLIEKITNYQKTRTIEKIIHNKKLWIKLNENSKKLKLRYKMLKLSKIGIKI